VTRSKQDSLKPAILHR